MTFQFARASFAPRLATRFGHRTPISMVHGDAANPITEDTLRARVPSIFADAAHASRSTRYGYIPTIEMVRGLNNEGFVPVMAVEAKARDVTKTGYTKHMVRFRRNDVTGRGSLGSVPEVILINSHDGSTSYQLLAGMFRFVCCNGMICGEGFEDIRIRHRAHQDLVRDVIDGAYTVVDTFKLAIEQGETMKTKLLTHNQQQAFGEAALAVKYFDEETNKVESPITPGQVISARRHEDIGTAGNLGPRDLWTTFNVVQENLIRGGLTGQTRDANGRTRRASTRAVNGIDGNVKLNRALWTLATRMAELAA